MEWKEQALFLGPHKIRLILGSTTLLLHVINFFIYVKEITQLIRFLCILMTVITIICNIN